MIDPALASLAQSLVPLPRRMALRPGRFVMPREPLWTGATQVLASALERLRSALESVRPRTAGRARIEFVLEPSSGIGPEGYALETSPDGVRVWAATNLGLTHGARTLTQLVRATELDWTTTGPLQEPAGTCSLPALRIEDAPALARRGVMLDVSRDRVPRMDRLLELVERLAEWKLNQLQLYFEHAFAYRGHERVWRGVDPFTPAEIRALDRHCTSHGIELVPNQQSFGHLHHWLKHDAYRHLAEVPEGIRHPFLEAGGQTPEPFSLCPTAPQSLDFLGQLYDQLLPCFSSSEFNVGLDETIDLGPGRSAEAIRARGVGRVYLEFLKQVHRQVAARGKRMQFWADIVLHHAELVPEVPKDTLACLWGYEADHPFGRETRLVAESGLPFLVCPGTSSWQSIGGRIDNMTGNVTAAVREGLAHGARGLLITDWGDRGHLQPPCSALPGFFTAADRAWNPDQLEAAAGERLELGLDAVLRGAAGRRLARLGRAADPCRVPVRNASVLSLLLTRFDEPFPLPELQGLAREDLERTAERCDALHLAGISPAEAQEACQRSAAPERGRREREMAWAGELLAFCARLGVARLEAGDGRPLAALPGRRRRALAEELAPLVERQRALWLESSRPGGLQRSIRWLERPLEALRGRAGTEAE